MHVHNFLVQVLDQRRSEHIRKPEIASCYIMQSQSRNEVTRYPFYAFRCRTNPQTNLSLSTRSNGSNLNAPLYSRPDTPFTPAVTNP